MSAGRGCRAVRHGFCFVRPRLGTGAELVSPGHHDRPAMWRGAWTSGRDGIDRARWMESFGGQRHACPGALGREGLLDVRTLQQPRQHQPGHQSRVGGGEPARKCAKPRHAVVQHVVGGCCRVPRGHVLVGLKLIGHEGSSSLAPLALLALQGLHATGQRMNCARVRAHPCPPLPAWGRWRSNRDERPKRDCRAHTGHPSSTGVVRLDRRRRLIAPRRHRPPGAALGRPRAGHRQARRRGSACTFSAPAACANAVIRSARRRSRSSVACW